MLKKKHKARVAINQFDLNTLPICGAKTRSGYLCEHRGNIDNSRCKRHVRASTGPINPTYGPRNARYTKGVRTKEAIAIRKQVAYLQQH